MPDKILCGLIVKGNHKSWSFDVWVDPKYLDEWREDGLDIDEIVETIEGLTGIDQQVDDLLKGSEG